MVKIIGIPRISALGLKGPEEMAGAVSKEMKKDFEMIEIDNSNVEESERKIYEKALGSFEDKTCFVGGDHSITYPIFGAFREKYSNPFLIVFDAHPDCMPPMKEPTHEEFLRAIIERGMNPKNIILIGARKFEKEERDFLIKSGVKVFSEINDIEAAADYVTEKSMGRDIYVSVDIDALDPAFAPAVNYPEPDGLVSKDFFYLIRRIFKTRGIRAMDIVEAVPAKDKNFDMRTIKTCVRVIEEFSR